MRQRERERQGLCFLTLVGADQAARERDQDLYFSVLCYRPGRTRPQAHYLGHCRSVTPSRGDHVQLGASPFAVGDVLLIEKVKRLRQ